MLHGSEKYSSVFIYLNIVRSNKHMLMKLIVSINYPTHSIQASSRWGVALAWRQ